MDLRKAQTDHLVATGMVLGLPDGFEFDKTKPYTACCLCGAVYQGALDLRVPPGHEPHNSIIARLAKNNRDAWASEHARKEHKESEHMALRRSGRFATPEASQKLAALGIVSLVDMILDDEVSNALKEGSPMPEREVEN